MPTVTPLLLTQYVASDGLYPIVIRVAHQGKRRLIPVGYRIEEKQWAEGRVRSKHPEHALINNAIAAKQADINRYLADCRLKGKPVHLELIGQPRTAHSFTDYLSHRADQYEKRGMIVMSQKCKRFVKELGEAVYFEDIDLDFLRRLEQQMIDAGNINNTRHKKFKFLREFYGHAILEGKAPAPNPFKSYKIPLKPVKKDRLTEAEIRAIEQLDLVDGALKDARNLLLFSYYCHGMRFGECLLLRRSDIAGGRIVFTASKGNKHLSVKIHPRLQAILDLYDCPEFVFPYLKEMPATPREKISAIGSWNALVNRYLKIVGRLAKIKTPLTFHIARHTFAQHLKKRETSIHVIQEALGHSDVQTTQLYLESLGDDTIDRETGKLYGE